MVGVGTNLRPRETTSHSAVERVCPGRLMTVLGVCIVILFGWVWVMSWGEDHGNWYVKGSKGVVG